MFVLSYVFHLYFQSVSISSAFHFLSNKDSKNRDKEKVNTDGRTAERMEGDHFTE